MTNINTDPNSYQEGGDHYMTEDGAMQHWDLVWLLHGTPYFIDNITKYVERFRRKNGKKDLGKAAQYAHKLFSKLGTGELVHFVVPDNHGHKHDAIHSFINMRQRSALEKEILLKSFYIQSTGEVLHIYDCIQRLIDQEYQTEVGEATGRYTNQDHDLPHEK